jgi:hypothetical protein
MFHRRRRSSTFAGYATTARHALPAFKIAATCATLTRQSADVPPTALRQEAGAWLHHSLILPPIGRRCSMMKATCAY